LSAIFVINKALFMQMPSPSLVNNRNITLSISTILSIFIKSHKLVHVPSFLLSAIHFPLNQMKQCLLCYPFHSMQIYSKKLCMYIYIWIYIYMHKWFYFVSHKVCPRFCINFLWIQEILGQMFTLWLRCVISIFSYKSSIAVGKIASTKSDTLFSPNIWIYYSNQL